MANAVSYEKDFVAWAIRSAELLRSGQHDGLDLEHLAEEVEGLGNWDRRQAKSSLRRILRCFIKWQLQPERRTRSSWHTTIAMQRQHVSSILRDSPSLRNRLNEQMQRLYSDALKEALALGQLTSHSLPLDCPFTLEQVLDQDFLPK